MAMFCQMFERVERASRMSLTTPATFRQKPWHFNHAAREESSGFICALDFFRISALLDVIDSDRL